MRTYCHRYFNIHFNIRFILHSAILSVICLLFVAQQPARAQEQGVAGEGETAVVHTYFLPIIVGGQTTQPPDPAFQFSGGPLYRAGNLGAASWYLRADSRISLDANGAEPFPFDPELDANSIAAKGEALYALADDGLYKRPNSSFRWEQISDIDGRYLSAAPAELWYTPSDHPGEVWHTTDDLNWASWSDGLTGTVVSPVFFNLSYNAGYFVVTQQSGQDTLWHASDASGSFQWKAVSQIPGNGIDQGKGFFSRVVDASNGLGVAVMVGSSDGKLYEYRFYNSTVPTDTVGEGWVVLWDFGAGNYPLPLFNNPSGNDASNEIAVINQSSGRITLYEGKVVENSTIPKWQWQVKPFPYEGLTFGVATLSDGKAVQRVYQSMDAPLGMAQMFLAQDGTLEAYEIDPATSQYRLSEVISQPQRIDFSLTYSTGIDSIGSLYSGAELKWQNGLCSGTENGFYRSDDKGKSWLQLTNDKPRHPLYATRGNSPVTLLAMSCAGPELSTNGGISWTTPAELLWPQSSGSALFAAHIPFASTEDPTFFAAGVDNAGVSYVYSSSFSIATKTLGPWHLITPGGLVTPTALAFVPSAVDPNKGLYLADANTVWMSSDSGATWSSRSDGLNGAKVVDFTGFSNVQGEGVIAATDRGVLFAPIVGQPAVNQPGQWIASEYAYTTNPIGFDGAGMLAALDGGKEVVFTLPSATFVWK